MTYHHATTRHPIRSSTGPVFNRLAAVLPAHRLSAGVLLLGLALCNLAARAQQNTRNLTGMISSGHREPLKGAIVQVENQSTHAVVSYITNETGLYSFKRLQSDSDYSVWVTFRGQRSKTRTLSSFDTHTNPVIDFIIHPE